MKIVVLSSETLHHAYFVRELTKAYPVELVMLQTGGHPAPYEIGHPYESEREEHERRVWFDGRGAVTSDFAETREFESMNSDAPVALLRDLAPDVVVVFGTSKLSGEVIATCPDGMVNLHRGDPERYRGLNSHLWAIWHNDYKGLVTTLHRVNEELDDGEIVSQAEMRIFPGMKLSMLRQLGTEDCVSTTLSGLDGYARHGRFVARRQRKEGRYYSFMPGAMKGVCAEKLEAHMGGL